jgi:hypothetical protein
MTKLESNADRTHTPPMSRPLGLRSLSTGSSSQSYYTAPPQTDSNFSGFSIYLPRFKRSLRHHSRTKSGGDLPSPTEEDPRRKPAPLRRTNSVLENPNPAHSLHGQPAPPTSIPSPARRRKVSNPMSFVTGIFGRTTPSDGPSSRFFTRSRLLSLRGLNTPSVRTLEIALTAGSTAESGGRRSAREGIQYVKERKEPPTVLDSLSQSTTATDITFTPSSFSYTPGEPQNGPPTCSTTMSGACLTSDPSALSSPPRSLTALNFDQRSEETTTGAGSGTLAYATANVIASSSSPRITAYSQRSSQSMTPPSTSQTAAAHNTIPEDPPRSRVTSASTIRTANAHRSSPHSRSSSNKDLPAIPVPFPQRKDDRAKPEPPPLTLEDIIALESPKSWRSLSPQEQIPSSVSQPVKTPAKKAAITNQPRFPSTFRRLSLQEDWPGRQDSPLIHRSALPHTQTFFDIDSSTPGLGRVTPQEPLGAPVFQDTSRFSTPTPASVRPSPVRSARRTSGSNLSSGALRPTLPLRLSSRRSSITLPTVSPVSSSMIFP